MREILFRGKRTDNGKWVEGELFSNLIYDGRENEKRIGYIYFEQDGEIHGTAVYNVIPETVGQYTGLTDKNGQRIFEGDIVNEYDMPEEISNTGIVEWSNIFMGWHIRKTRSMYCHEYMSYEVIGNIHDNPELMKAVRNDSKL